MTDLRRMSVFRDVQVAMDFQQMASLGYIDTEFTMYGCAYWQDEQRQYVVSSNEGEIWRFIAESPQNNRYPTPIASLTKVCPVPMGQKEDIAQTVKVALAYQLQKDYPLAFFRDFAQMTAVENAESARALLEDIVQAAIDDFAAASLDLAEDLLLLAYTGKVLSSSTFHALGLRLERARDNLLEEAAAKDILRKSFFTIMVESAPGQYKKLTNARREWILRKKDQLEGAGKLVTPVYARTYWHNNQQSLDTVKKWHLENCERVLTEEYFAQVKAIAACAGAFEAEAFDAECQRLGRAYGAKAGQMLAHYARLWHMSAQ